MLHDHGVRQGHRVFILLPACIAWWESVLGCMKTGAVAVVAMDASSAAILRDQIAHAEARMIITTIDQAALINEIVDQCPTVTHRVAVGWEQPDWVDYDRRVSLAPTGFVSVSTSADDCCIIVYDQANTQSMTRYYHGDDRFDLYQLDAWRRGMTVTITDVPKDT